MQFGIESCEKKRKILTRILGRPSEGLMRITENHSTLTALPDKRSTWEAGLRQTLKNFCGIIKTV
jgi:hypothetical protein